MHYLYAACSIKAVGYRVTVRSPFVNRFIPYIFCTVVRKNKKKKKYYVKHELFRPNKMTSRTARRASTSRGRGRGPATFADLLPRRTFIFFFFFFLSRRFFTNVVRTIFRGDGVRKAREVNIIIIIKIRTRPVSAYRRTRRSMFELEEKKPITLMCRLNNVLPIS